LFEIVQIRRNSSADEIVNVNFLRRHRTRTTKYKKRRQKQAVKQFLKSYSINYEETQIIVQETHQKMRWRTWTFFTTSYTHHKIQ